MSRALLMLGVCCQNIDMQGQAVLPLNNDYWLSYENGAVSNNQTSYTFIRPFVFDTCKKDIDEKVLFSGYDAKPHKRYAGKKLFDESIVKYDTVGVKIYADPLFDFALSREINTNENYTTNTRGVRVWGNVNSSLFFEANVYESQATFLPYLYERFKATNAVSGQGRARKYDTGFDYGLASGRIAWFVSKKLLFSIGTDKMFVGNGYRSLLLTDNAFNYPYALYTLSVGKFKYTQSLLVLMGDSIPKTSFGVWERKLSSMHILSFLASQDIHLSVFEYNIYHYPNKRSNIDFAWEAVNPVMFVNTASQNEKSSSLLTFDMKVNIFNTLTCYGQLAASNIKDNGFKAANTGWQGGVKYYNAFTLRNLVLQYEHNKAGNKLGLNEDTLLNYTHHMQSLAHAWGNNFSENIIIAAYRHKRIFVNALYNWGSYGNKNYGEKEIKVLPGQSAYNDLKYFTLSLSYVLNPYTNRRLELGIMKREASYQNRSNLFFYFTFKTNLINKYYDF
ncbi:MAG TPA: hypothetical protein VIO15_01985 [Bacteroidales bacterium]